MHDIIMLCTRQAVNEIAQMKQEGDQRLMMGDIGGIIQILTTKK